MWVTRKLSLFVRSGLAACLCLLFLSTAPASALTAIPTPGPGSASYGLEATKTKPAPTVGASISVPGNGGSSSTSPITVSGICPDGLLVQVYNNGVMVGSVMCVGGSFTMQITLFTGSNELTASVFDELDQTGPVSNVVTVTYNNSSISAFGSLISLTSSFGRRAANPGASLVWPLQLSGGNGPYAFSIDWGDGTPADLKSQAAAGEVKINHVYKKAGVYKVVVKVTDAQGATAFLQLVAIANGQIAESDTKADTVKTVIVTKILWIPLIVAIAMLFPTYWLGRRSELFSLHKQLQKTVEENKAEPKK